MRGMRKRIEIPSMRDVDIRKALAERQLLERFEAGQLRCSVCETPLSWNNLGALIPSAEGLLLCCGTTECLEEAIRGARQ